MSKNLSTLFMDGPFGKLHKNSLEPLPLLLAVKNSLVLSLKDLDEKKKLIEQILCPFDTDAFQKAGPKLSHESLISFPLFWYFW